MFDDREVAVPTRSASSGRTVTADEITRLRERMHRMQGGMPRRTLDTHPALAGVVEVYAGGAYQVDSAALALALMSGPSRAGGWCAAVGMPDFGAEAAAELGVCLDRTVLVPEPGDLWVEATAALIDVAALVVVRPPGRVGEHLAEKLGARLRKRGAALVALCPPGAAAWPRAEARISAVEPQWSGAGRGEGHLRQRRLVVSVQRGSAPPRRAALWFPDAELTVRPAAHERVPYSDVREVG